MQHISKPLEPIRSELASRRQTDRQLRQSLRKSLGTVSQTDPWCCPACLGQGALLPGTDWAEHCQLCGGLGVICPQCRGARWVRARLAYSQSVAGARGANVQPCGGCCETAAVEDAAIRATGRSVRAVYVAQREAESIRQAYLAERARRSPTGTESSRAEP